MTLNTQEIRDRLDAAQPDTDGTIVVDGTNDRANYIIRDSWGHWVAECYTEAIADLYANAPADVRNLLAEVERLTAAEQAASEANYTFSFDLMQAEQRIAELTAELDTVAAANARLADDSNELGAALDVALQHLKESEAERDAAKAQHNALLAILAEGAKNLKAAEAERDALAGQLAKVQAEVARFKEIERYYQDRNNVIAETGSRRNSWQQP